MKKSPVMLCLLILLGAWACGGKGVNLEIHYEDVQGLSAEDRVIYADIPIGRVIEISRVTQGDYAVRVAIEEDFENLLTEHARFYIVRDPAADGRKAVELWRHRTGGALLADGAQVEGSVRLSDRFQDTADDFSAGLEELADELKGLSEEMARIPESEAYRRLESELKTWLEKMQNAGREARESFEEEVLPKLREELEALKERLRRRKQEEAPEPLSV